MKAFKISIFYCHSIISGYEERHTVQNRDSASQLYCCRGGIRKFADRRLFLSGCDDCQSRRHLVHRPLCSFKTRNLIQMPHVTSSKNPTWWKNCFFRKVYSAALKKQSQGSCCSSLIFILNLTAACRRQKLSFQKLFYHTTKSFTFLISVDLKTSPWTFVFEISSWK